MQEALPHVPHGGDGAEPDARGDGQVLVADTVRPATPTPRSATSHPPALGLGPAGGRPTGPVCSTEDAGAAGGVPQHAPGAATDAATAHPSPASTAPRGPASRAPRAHRTRAFQSRLGAGTATGPSAAASCSRPPRRGRRQRTAKGCPPGRAAASRRGTRSGGRLPGTSWNRRAGSRGARTPCSPQHVHSCQVVAATLASMATAGSMTGPSSGGPYSASDGNSGTQNVGGGPCAECDNQSPGARCVAPLTRGPRSEPQMGSGGAKAGGRVSVSWGPGSAWEDGMLWRWQW